MASLRVLRVSAVKFFSPVTLGSMQIPQWLLFALLSAATAALVPIFAKIGMHDVDANLATVLRGIAFTLVLLIFGTTIGVWSKTHTVGGRAVCFILLSGIAGAASWVFYFNAVKIGEVSRIAPIDKLSMPLAILLAVVILGDRPTGVNWAGIFLIAAGAYLASLPRPPEPRRQVELQIEPPSAGPPSRVQPADPISVSSTDDPTANP